MATSCIDNLNFKQNTKKISYQKIKDWENKNNKPYFLKTINSNADFIDLSQLIQIKLAVILYELHLRLTSYNYFNRTYGESASSSSSSSSSFSSSVLTNEINKTTNFEELSSHYSRLSKEKRVALVNWIWATFNRMKLFTNTNPSQLVDHLNRLTHIYSSSSVSSNHVLDSHLNNLLNQIALNSVIEPKCPLEKYLNLVFVCSIGIDLSYTFEQSIELIQTILSTHKKQSKLQEISYSLVFKWFENLIFKYTTKKLKRNYSIRTINNQNNYGDSSTPVAYLNFDLNQLRQAKQANIQKLATLLLIIFNPNSTQSSAIINDYCEQILRRLNKFNSINYFKNDINPGNK
jgi:hypothetical protein